MPRKLYLEFISCVSEKGFTLDELVMETKELFEIAGMPGFVSLILSLFDERICRMLTSGQPVGSVSACRCGKSDWETCSHEDRQIRTSIGVVNFTWRRLRGAPAPGWQRPSYVPWYQNRRILELWDNSIKF